jgi:hypothetical protein
MYRVRSQKAMLSLISSPLSHREIICYGCKNVSTDEVFFLKGCLHLCHSPWEEHPTCRSRLTLEQGLLDQNTPGFDP